MSRWDGIEPFLAVGETGSFTRAAARLKLSVSQVSREIARLEERLDTQLLSRTTRRVTLTEAGAILLDRARNMIDDREEAFDAVSRTDAGAGGLLRVTCSVAYGERHLMPLINQFLSENPAISVMVDLSNRLVDLVGDGFDLGIRTGSSHESKLKAAPLTTRSRHLCASPAYLERSGTLSSLDDMENHYCLLGTSERWEFTQSGQIVQFNPKAQWRCNSGFAVLDAALHGLGICQLPDFYVETHLASGALVELLPQHRPEEQVVWAVYPDRAHQPVRLVRLIDFLQDQLGPASD